MIKNLLRQSVDQFRKNAKEKRKRIFLDYFEVDKNTRILDLGSGNGTTIFNVIKDTSYTEKNIYIADIVSDAIAVGNQKYGFTPVLIDENSPLEFKDHFFDIIFCSSVIEHVTIPKNRVLEFIPDSEFAKLAIQRQREFAQEIKRLGRGYFAQTPNRDFIIESHTWLPFVGWLTRKNQIKVIQYFNRFWIKKTNPDFHLLRENEFMALFPDATLRSEKFLGQVKSWMAIKKVSS